MKKNLVTLLSLIISSSLLAGCGVIVNPGGESGSKESDTSESESGSQGSSESGSQGSSDSGDAKTGFDAYIEDYLSGTNLSVPSLNEYNLDYDVLYYYAQSLYIVTALGNAPHETDFLAKMQQTSWVSGNDDTYYTVEEYGYIFVDNTSNPSVEIDFYDTADGGFYFDIYRFDKGHGKIDVSKVDTNWYVDYVNFNGMQVSETVPANELKQALGVSKTLTDLGSDYYAYGFTAKSDDNPADVFKIVVKGSEMATYVNKLTAQGFELTLQTYESFFGDEVTYYTGYDTNQELYVLVELDEVENTTLIFSPFDQVLVSKLTENTDWTDAEKAIMNQYLGRAMPFIQMGDGYKVQQVDDDTYPYVEVSDSYYQDRTNIIAQTLLDAGWKKDATTYQQTVYIHDDKNVYVEAWPGYDDGNYIEFYYEPTHFIPAETIDLNVEEVDIVVGATFQLSVKMEPAKAESTYTFSSDNEELATVDENGLVSVSPMATTGNSFVITVTTSENKTDTCKFNIVEPVLEDFVLSVEKVDVIPGGTFEGFEVVSTKPYGMDVTLELSQKYPGNEHITIDDEGHISASADAEIGETATIVVQAQGTTIVKEIPLSVVSPEITDTLTQASLSLAPGSSTYVDCHATGESGAFYFGKCASSTGIQIRSKSSDSGIVAEHSSKVAKSITIIADPRTTEGSQTRTIEIYGSDEPFEVADMYGSSLTKVGELTFSGSDLTKTYNFTTDYSFIGIRTNSGAAYLEAIIVTWGM